jgi:hypothetical protein
MTRNIIGIAAALVTWVVASLLAGLVMRNAWPAYAAVADAMTFTLSMMIARLSIGAVATILMGFVVACITPSARARLLPGIIALLVFIPQHAMLWEKFPLWYHAAFLLSLVPLTYVGNAIASNVMRQRTGLASV